MYAKKKKIAKCVKKLAPKMVLHTLEKRKADLSNRIVANCDGTKPMILIDKLLDLEERGLMDRQRVLDQINTFVVAVSEA